MKSYVITGGPGIGKTTVLEVLSVRGFAIVPEAARMIIEEETLKNSDVLPWKDLRRFQDEVAKRQLHMENRTKALIRFLDRGIIDGYAYCVLGKVTPPEIISQYGRNRYEKVFLLEPLGIYSKDKSRVEDRKFALDIHDEIVKAYKLFGYDIIKVPVLSPEKRADFIICTISGTIMA